MPGKIFPEFMASIEQLKRNIVARYALPPVAGFDEFVLFCFLLSEIAFVRFLILEDYCVGHQDETVIFDGESVILLCAPPVRI
jgi:hypothetical protein